MQSVAIIGAGASGLPAIKCCLDEGLDLHALKGRTILEDCGIIPRNLKMVKHV